MVWDFTDYETENLKKALKHMNSLILLGFEQNEDLLFELKSELDKRRNIRRK